MNSSEIRRRFLDFFEKKDHEVLSSKPLLTSDPDLLFNIAGMVPFKPYFLGEEPPPSSRISTAQKCIRTEDIEQVGQTARHLTFFEMLGNFSFGDYFKQEAINYAWEFFVEELNLDPDRLWITVFGGDERDDLDADREAESIWTTIDGVRENRILQLGTEENFWKIGPTGPCGPCSEILYDQESKDADPETVKRMILDGKDRILELWNLVFMEFNRPREQANLEPLPEKNIDTGLGLERLAAILQDADSNFGTDLFRPLIEKTKELTGSDLSHERNQSRARVVADHLRASAFLLSEGLLPGNEGRGYVLRRLIRRAHLRGRRLGLREPFLSELVPTLIDIMGDHFQELPENQDEITKQLTNEEEQFEQILDRGISELDDRIESLRTKNQSSMSGEEIFDLYETHGLPLEMTKDVLDEEGINYDENEIEEARKEHEERSRDESHDDEGHDFDFDGVPETDFTGYDQLERESEIVALYTGSERNRVDSITGDDIEENAFVVLDRTPFYAEGGGQSGDKGWIIDGNWWVYNTTEQNGYYVHAVEPKNHPETLNVGETVPVSIDRDFRRGNMRHHTATHLLHHALRRELGEQVIQDGSALDDESLRFDFTYNEAVDRDTLDAIEDQINEWIYRKIPVETAVMNREQAEEMGALAFFGEHYGQEVRVVMIEDHDGDPDLDSKEFCGGTHLKNTEDIGLFVITNETAVAAGVRRIEAKAGEPAYKELRDQRSVLRESSGKAGVQQPEQLPRRIEELQTKLDETENDLERLRQKESANRAEKLAANAEKIGGVPVVTEVLEDVDDESLKTMLDEIRQRLDSGIIFLASRDDQSVKLVLGITEDLTDSIDAGDWIRELGEIVGGGGGGRPDFAEAGGSRPEAVDKAIDQLQTMIRETLGETARN